MSSAANQYPEVHQQPGEYTPPTLDKVLSGVHLRAQQRWGEQAALIAEEQLQEAEQTTASTESTHDKASREQEAQRQVVLQAFYGYAKQVHGIDPENPKPIDEPKLAHALHHFVDDAVTRKKTQNTKLMIINSDRADKAIDEHYGEYGLKRDSHTDSKMPDELAAIKQLKKKLEIREFHEQNGMRGVPRIEGYTQIGIVAVIADTLRADGSTLAADAADVVIASYARTFPSVLTYSSIEIQDEEGNTTRTINPDWEKVAGRSMVQGVTVPGGEQPDRPGGFRR